MDVGLDLPNFHLQWHHLIPGVTLDEWLNLDLPPCPGSSQTETVITVSSGVSEAPVVDLEMLPLDLYVDLLSEDPDLQLTQPYDMPMDIMDPVDQPQGPHTQQSEQTDRDEANATDDDVDDDVDDEDDGDVDAEDDDGDIDIDKFIEDQKNPATLRKTKQHMQLLRHFLQNRGEGRNPEDVSPTDLNELLARFFITVKPVCQPGDASKEYEPSTIKGIQSSISRYLKEKKYSCSIINSDEFFKSREAVASKCKSLKSEGYGNRQGRKRAPNQQEYKDMWKKGALGDSSPSTLQHTMWWIMCTRFGLRANKENYDLKWGDLQLVESETDSGKNYLVLPKERTTKTRSGADVGEVREEIRVYEDEEEPKYCPVRMYSLYAKKRPSSMNSPGSNFYLQPKQFLAGKQESEETWYKSQVCVFCN